MAEGPRAERWPGGGEELLRRLREEGGGHDRRLIFMTRDAAGEDTARILRASAVPVVETPRAPGTSSHGGG